MKPVVPLATISLLDRELSLKGHHRGQEMVERKMHRVRCPGKGGLSWRVDEDFLELGTAEE